LPRLKPGTVLLREYQFSPPILKYISAIKTLHPEAPAGRHTSVRRHRESLLSEILAGKTGVATLVAHSACFSATAPTAAAASQSTQLMRASPM
jgi:hypothetical protein